MTFFRVLNKIRTLVFSKRPFKLSGGGWVFILYTIGIGAGAINTGNNLIYLIFGIFLGLILASGVLSDLSLWGLSANLSFPISSPAGRLMAIPIEITNANKRFPSISLRVEIHGHHKGVPVILQLFTAALPAGQTFRGQFLWTPPRRGWFEVTELRFITQFPFGLLSKWWTSRLFTGKAAEFDRHSGFAVLPAPVFIDASKANAGSMAHRDTAPFERRGEGLTMFGVREFQESDNPKRIHWKVSAKKAAAETDWQSSYMVKQMESEEQPAVRLLISDLSEATPAEVDALIGYAWSMFEFYSDLGGHVSVLLFVSGCWYEIGRAVLQDRRMAVSMVLAVVEPSNFESPAIRAFLTPCDPRPVVGILDVDVIDRFRRENAAKVAS